MDENETVAVKVDLPKRAYDFLKNEAKLRNKTVEEYVDFVIQADIAGTLIQIADEGGSIRARAPMELAVDLGLDGYISEGKKQWADYVDVPPQDRRQNRSWD